MGHGAAGGKAAAIDSVATLRFMKILPIYGFL
jgi:hypothetical protein